MIDNDLTAYGELASDPEVRHTSGGKPVVKGQIKTGRSWTAPTGETKVSPVFLDYEWFGGDWAVKRLGSLRKGARVKMKGALGSESFTGKDGQTRWKTIFKLEGCEQQGPSSSAPKPPAPDPMYDVVADQDAPF